MGLGQDRELRVRAAVDIDVAHHMTFELHLILRDDVAHHHSGLTNHRLFNGRDLWGLPKFHLFEHGRLSA